MKKVFLIISVLVIFFVAMYYKVSPVFDSSNNSTNITESPQWNLSDLYSSNQDSKIEQDKALIANEVKFFVDKYKGKIAKLDSNGFLKMLQDYESIYDKMSILGSYSFLQYCTDINNSEKVKFYNNINNWTNEISLPLNFWSLEINAIDEVKINKLLADINLAKYKFYISDIRKYKSHQLSEEMETLMQEKSATSNQGWDDIYNYSLAQLRFDINGEKLDINKVMDLISDKDRSKRQSADEALRKTFNSNSSAFAIIFNNLLKDKSINDKYRKFPRAISSRNLANSIDDEIVDTMIGTVIKNYPKTSHKYYKIKSKILGFEKLAYYDRNSPLPSDEDQTYTWEQAKEIVLESYREFSPEFAEIGKIFFDKHWIDAKMSDGKMSGAFSHPVATSKHPYIMVNFSGKIRDIMTLAHELGHGIHQYLAQKNGPLLAGTPLIFAETASIFGEKIVFHNLLKKITNNKVKKSLLANKIQDEINTIIRQISFHNFEDAIHKGIKSSVMSSDDFAKMWLETQRASLGEFVDMTDDHGNYWLYISHFFHTPFYVYAYAFGNLLVNGLYNQYLHTDNKQLFIDKYSEMLTKGGSVDYHNLIDPLNIKLDQSFWQGGVDDLIDMINEFESLDNAS